MSLTAASWTAEGLGQAVGEGGTQAPKLMRSCWARAGLTPLPATGEAVIVKLCCDVLAGDLPLGEVLGDLLEEEVPCLGLSSLSARDSRGCGRLAACLSVAALLR